jgi:probable HAF family extracellular repeat protein
LTILAGHLAVAAPAQSGEPQPFGSAVTTLSGPNGSVGSVVSVWTDEPSQLFLAAGSARASNGETHAMLWQNGEPLDLGTLGGDYSAAAGGAQDAEGTAVVGASRTADGRIHAFLWRPGGAMIQLPNLGASRSVALALEPDGRITGYLDLASGRRVCCWSSVTLQITDLGSRPVLAPAQAPTLSTVSPNSGVQGQTRIVTLAGHGFVPGATVSFGSGITVNSAVVSVFGGGIGVLADHLLTVSVTIAPDAAPGLRSVMVTNPDQQSVTKPNAFTVIDPDAASALDAFMLTPSTARGGAKQRGSVTLTFAAPAPRGARVTFTSSNPTVKPPRAVLIKKGKTALPRPFVYQSKRVREITTATITASYGGVSKSVEITLTP